MNKCQCGITWHLCPTHRTDPAVHRSRKAPKIKDKENVPRRRLDPRRKPPEIMQVAKKRKAVSIRGQRKSQAAKTYCYGIEEAATIKPQVEMIQRIRLKRNAEVINEHDEMEDDVAKRRTLNAVSLHDNKKQPRCNGGVAGECSLTRALMPA